jgi:acyl homoserine lactone synthase
MSDFQILVRDNRADVDLLTEMHRLRFRVFKERLDWNVAVSGGMEIDNFDILSPTYLLLIDRRRTLIGSVRLLPTTGPTMLGDVFPQLLADQPMPRSPVIWESSRFCIDIERAQSTLRSEQRSGVNVATVAMLAGMTEWGLARGVRQVVTVTDTLVERLVNKAHCPTRRFAPPMQVGKTRAVATATDLRPELLADIRAAGGFTHPMIHEDIPAAAIRRSA